MMSEFFLLVALVARVVDVNAVVCKTAKPFVVDAIDNINKSR